MMKKFCCLSLCISLNILGSVYSVDTKKALTVVSNATKHMLVFVNIDMHDLDHLYLRNFDEMVKKAKTLCQHQKEEGYQILSFINSTMRTIDPLYISSYRLAPQVIGLTRRPLRWSHLVRKACYDQAVKKPAERYLYVIEKEHPRFEGDYEFVECNTGILYLDKADIGQAIDRYLVNYRSPLHGIIYMDTNKENVASFVQTLQELQPDVKVIGLHVER